MSEHLHDQILRQPNRNMIDVRTFPSKKILHPLDLSRCRFLPLEPVSIQKW